METPDSLLIKNYQENSNQAIIVGTLVTEPQFIATTSGNLCRYGLGVDRKYYVKEQAEQHADYPWVYSYGEQAEWDAKYLMKKSVILMDGFIHNEWYTAKLVCSACKSEYTKEAVGTQFTPYSIGIPTNDPETRIFFSDIDSCRQFANLYKVLFLQGNLNQENINRLVDAVQSGKTSGYGIVPMNLEVEVDTEYAGYPQFIRQSSRKTELLNKKAEQLELNLA